MIEKCIAAVDIGTTNIQINIVSHEGIVQYKTGFSNPLKKYGSDVISRITNSVKNDNLKKMNLLLTETIYNEILNKSGYGGSIDKICIAANVTMAALFLGLPIETLGKSPFTMPFLDVQTIRRHNVEVVVLSGASAFIGGDIISGALYLKLNNGDILMDLGTNGEIIIKNNDKYYASSAACGPAFENCTRAKGIFGGVTITDISNGIRQGRINRNGTFTGDYSYDILHNVMLAKTAIYATLHLLMEDAGLTLKDVNKIYISGGFGFDLSIIDAANIGIIPYTLKDKVVISGNTSIEGAIYVMAFNKINDFIQIKDKIEVFQYGGDERYNNLFIDSLGFYRRNI